MRHGNTAARHAVEPPRCQLKLAVDFAFLPAALGAGALIGLLLGMVGGGGSILAVPLLVYVVGVASPHVAIGTAAVGVAVNAFASMIGHARAGRVKWPCAAVFALAGMIGAVLGAELGKAIDGQRLLALFGVLMIGVGLAMMRKRRTAEAPDVRLNRASAAVLLPRLLPGGLGVGLAAGFFGIGGGFLIVPVLMMATAMPLSYAIGTSLVVVTALGATTATSYALSGLVDWVVTAHLVAGGAVGIVVGMMLGARLGKRKGLLERVFASGVILVGLYIVASAL